MWFVTYSMALKLDSRKAAVLEFCLIDALHVITRTTYSKVVTQFEFVSFTWKSMNTVFNVLNAKRETEAILNFFRFALHQCVIPTCLFDHFTYHCSFSNLPPF